FADSEITKDVTITRRGLSCAFYRSPREKRTLDLKVGPANKEETQLENDVKNRSVNLTEFYSYLGRGVVCCYSNDNWLFAGFPFERHYSGCLIIRGKAAENLDKRYIAALSTQPGSVPFRNLSIVKAVPSPLDVVVQEHEGYGFRVIEQPVTLEDLVRRNHLPSHCSINPEVRAKLEDALRDLRFRSLTTETLAKNAIWA
ncbi:hypothetical protein, partial [Acidithiobacillus caldus]